MKENYPFVLNERLMLCADFIEEGSRLADIGSDHAYLPIFTALTGKVNLAVACDINQGPLKNGMKNIQKYGVQNVVETRLSDGLYAVSKDEVDAVVIAGMGGELIARIVEQAPWLKDKGKYLVLQPMTKGELLRRYLYKNGFCIEKEECTLWKERVYSVMKCRYSGETCNFSVAKEYIGLIDPKLSKYNRLYIEKVIYSLTKKAQGIALSGDKDGSNEIYDIINCIKEETQWQE